MKSNLSHKIWEDTRDIWDLAFDSRSSEYNQVCQFLDSKNIQTLNDFDQAMLCFLSSNQPGCQIKLWIRWPKANRWRPEEVIISIDRYLQGRALWIENGNLINWITVRSFLEKRNQFEVSLQRQRADSSGPSFDAFIHSFPLPCLVIEKNGEFVAQNKKFSEHFRNVNEFIQYAKDHEVIQAGELFQINQVGSAHLNMFFLIPLTQDNRGENDTGAEAGVVCGSLAHELNNPLSSIMMGLETLIDESDLKPIRSELDELLSNAHRARDLVRIFLGFSKYEHPLKASCDWEAMANAALELLRGRFIEGEVGLHLHLQKSEHKTHIGHCSYIAMLFFLLFDEILTQASHFHLIRGKDINRSKWIEAYIKHEKNGISIDFSDQNLYFSPPKNNPLLNFILHSLQLEIIEQGQRLSLQFKGDSEDIFAKVNCDLKNLSTIDGIPQASWSQDHLRKSSILDSPI